MTNYWDYLINTIHKPLIAGAIIACVTILSYANIFQNTFVWDDNATILQWTTTRSWSNIPRMFVGETPPGHPGNYRPIRNILYIVSYHLWGTNTYGYHVQTILLATGIALLTYIITRQLFPTSHTIPFFTALLFAAHPIHVEALTWMTSMMDMFGIFFAFAGISTYLQWVRTKKISWYCLSVLLVTLAIFGNEIALATPLILAYITIIFRKPTKQTILSLIPFFAVIGANAVVRIMFLGIGARFVYIGNTLTTTGIVMLQALLTYYSLLLFPFSLTINHNLGNGLSSWAIELLDPGSVGYKAVQALRITSPSVLLSIAITVSLLVLMAALRKRIPLLSLGIAWFFLAFIPVSNLIPTEAVLTERYIFFSSYGFCLCIAWLFSALGSSMTTLRHLRSKIAWALFAVVIVTGIVLTIQRNSEWKNDATLYTSAVARNPQALIAHITLANAYYGQGNIEQALSHYLSAYTINPTPDDISLYIAAAYHALGKNTEASIYLSRVMKKNPWNIEAYFRLGNLYKEMGQYDKAIDVYTTGLKVAPNHVQILNNIGVILSMQQRYTDAIPFFTKALQADPSYIPAQNNLTEAQKASRTAQ